MPKVFLYFFIRFLLVNIFYERMFYMADLSIHNLTGSGVDLGKVHICPKGDSRELKDVLGIIKAAHAFYVKGTEQEKGKILEVFEDKFDILEREFGYHRSFGVLCLLYGDEFVQAEFKFKTFSDFIESL